MLKMRSVIFESNFAAPNKDQNLFCVTGASYFFVGLFRARASSKFLSSPLKYRRLLRGLIKVLHSVIYRESGYKLSARRFLGVFGWTFASYSLRLDTIEQL